MRSFIVLIALGVVFIEATDLNEDYAKLILQHRGMCIKNTNVDIGLLEKARRGDYSDDAAFRSHIFCVSKRIGFQDDSGNLVPEVVKAKVKVVYGGEADELIAMCLSKSEDPVEVAVATFKCFYEKGSLVLI